MTNLLKVHDLAVEFTTAAGTVRAIDGASFTVPSGGSVALVGESGSGKSVTAQAILGILPRNGRVVGGEILFTDRTMSGGGLDLATLHPDSVSFRRLRGKHISMIFQEPMTSLSPVHTVGDQVGEALGLHAPIGRKELRARTIDMLRLVGFPDAVRAHDTYPFELSGGLRQRAMIAMALICRPSLLIADEPTTALDVTIQAQILKLIGQLRHDLGMALLLITHDLGVVANVAEDVVVMYQGRIMESGPLRTLFENPQHPYLQALLGAVPHFDMQPGERLRPLRDIERRQSGRFADVAREQPTIDQPADGLPLLDVRNLSKTFTIRKGASPFASPVNRKIIAADDVSFLIERGSCFGLVGESGCGKTTVSKIIMRAIKADSGQVLFNDGSRLVDLTTLSERDLALYRKRIQYVFQDPFSSLNPRMTVFDILSEPFLIHGIGTAGERRGMVSELMEMVGLDPRYLRRFPHSFSGGQRQRIGIARALALRPDLIICDEPVSALDVSVQAQVLNLLKDLQAELGLTYLFISHNLAVVDYMADRIAVMCAGRIVETAPKDKLFENPVHPYTKALFAAVPYADPDRQLDFTALMDGRASVPAAWPPPFNDDRLGEPGLVEVARDHLVRAHMVRAADAELAP
jgi:peptide/nickel transport system ATP-binding protein